MDALNSRANANWTFGNEVKQYLAPSQTDSREHIAKIALGKMKGVKSVNLAVRVTKAVEKDELHKGTGKRLREYRDSDQGERQGPKDGS